MIHWATKNQCKLVISATGIPNEGEIERQDNTKTSNMLGSGATSKLLEVYALTSTEEAANIAKERGLDILRSGTITGTK